jgi:hypothetical protein
VVMNGIYETRRKVRNLKGGEPRIKNRR